jgi:nucleoside-diphosphate-sugar epimerase
MEKDDFKYTLSFGDDVFGGPVWKNLVPPDAARRYFETGTIPLLLDAHGRPLKRNFVHVDDLVEAIALAIGSPATKGKLYNVCMNEPVDYGEVARHLKQNYGLPSVEIPSHYHSNWMDNAAAKYTLGWRPSYDLSKLIDSAWTYRRSADDPRKIWYPG